MADVTANRPAETDSAKLRRGQRLVIALLLIGYSGYYLCRADFSAAIPQILTEFKAQHITKSVMGGVASLATLCYAIGKFFSGSLADLLGGRRMFLIGMAGSVLFTLLFPFGPLPIFTIAWSLNKLIQSTGWVGMVKITSRWFSFSAYGAVMGIISLSYLFGEFFSKQFLGYLQNQGMGWRGLFYVAAAVLGVIFLATLLLLKESPRDIGEPEPEANPLNVFGAGGQSEKAGSLRELLLPLLTNPLFWTVCLLSLGFTLVRDTFGTWTPTYLHEAVGMKEGDATQASSLFPLFGGLSVLAVGFLSDRLGRGGRAAIIFIGLLISIPALLILSGLRFTGSPVQAEIMLGLIAFVMIGPYSFLAGSVSLDFGGKRGSATAAGWIDGIGYLGGIAAGKVVGKIAEDSGWSKAFLMLTGVAALTCLAAAVYWIQIRRARETV